MYNASYDGLPYDIKNWASTFRPDNIRLDQEGNIKLKEGEATARLGTEIPQQQVVTNPGQQFFGQTTYNQAYNPIRQGEQAYMAQMQQSMTQPMMTEQVQQPNWNGYNAPENRQMLVDSPVQVTQQTAPQIIKQSAQTVEAETPNESIQSILSKLNIQ